MIFWQLSPLAKVVISQRLKSCEASSFCTASTVWHWGRNRLSPKRKTFRFEYRVVLSNFPSKTLSGSHLRNCLSLWLFIFQFSQTYTNIYLTYFSCYIYEFNVLSRHQSLFYVFQFFMRSQSSLFLIRKACFLFLSFLCDSDLRFSLFTKFIFSVSLFFFSSLSSLFLIKQSLFFVS